MGNYDKRPDADNRESQPQSHHELPMLHRAIGATIVGLVFLTSCYSFFTTTARTFIPNLFEGKRIDYTSPILIDSEK